MRKTFLKAEWRKLIMANYAVDPQLLTPYLPCKTALDYWNDTCYLSLVGFMFMNTKVGGLRIPFHVNFEEINLRFYVRHQKQGVYRRGVVFVKEIVPRPALSLVANTLYKEKYVTMPTSHLWQSDDNQMYVKYEWGKGKKHSLQVTTAGIPKAAWKGAKQLLSQSIIGVIPGYQVIKLPSTRCSTRAGKSIQPKPIVLM